MAPIVKCIPAAKSGPSLKSREEYIRDAAHAAPGELFGPKVAFGGVANGDGDDWRSAVYGMHVKEAIYETDGAKTEHWIMSLRKGEQWTPETASAAVETLQRHLNYPGPVLWTVHHDSDNSHLHMVFPRIAEGQDGQYHLAISGGSECNPTSGHTYTHLSAAKAEAEIRAAQGWSREKLAVYDFTDGQFIRATYPKPDQDKIRLGTRVETAEAHSGQPHPKRILAEAAVAEIRAVTDKDKPEVIRRLTAAGIRFEETEKGGKLFSEAVPKGIKLSALPKDCRWIWDKPVPGKVSKIELNTTTFDGAKSYIKRVYKDAATGTEFLQKLDAKNLVFEQTGKAGGRIRFGQGPADVVKLSEAGISFSRLMEKFGNLSAFEQLHASSVNVNASSEIMHGNGGNNASKVHEKSTADTTRAIFEERKTETQTNEALAAEGITLTRETGMDAKTGKPYQYGLLSREGEASITLKALGTDDKGKPLYSLPILDRQFLVADAEPILAATRDQGRTATAVALLDAGITLSEVRKTGEDGREYSYGQLERNGVTVSLSTFGRDDKGRVTYSLSALDRTEVINLARPIVDTYAGRGRTALAAALNGQGLALTEATATITKDGQEVEVKYGQIERNGIAVPLSAFGKEDGKALHSLFSLDKKDREIAQEALRGEAMPVISAEAKKGWDHAVAACAIHKIKLSEEPVVIRDKDGTEKEVIYARVERDGVAVSLKSLVGEDGKPLFHARELQRRQLAMDAASIIDQHPNWREAGTAFTAADIAYSRVKTTITDKDGQEKEIIIGRLERAGVVTTTSYAGKDYSPAAIDARYMPYAEAKSYYEQARTQAQPVAFLAAQGLTVSDIDRIGRVGEKSEKAIQRKEKPADVARPAAPAPTSGKSIIPKNINEILDLIAESAEQAAALAQANAKAGRAAILANRADARARKAEQALAELRASIKHEEPKPAPQGPKEKDMATGTGGAALAPEATKEKPLDQEVKPEVKAPENDAPNVDQDRPAEQEQPADDEQATQADQDQQQEEIDLFAPVPVDDDWTDDQPYDDDDPTDADRM